LYTYAAKLPLAFQFFWKKIDDVILLSKFISFSGIAALDASCLGAEQDSDMAMSLNLVRKIHGKVDLCTGPPSPS
jgi:hypothetical protein